MCVCAFACGFPAILEWMSPVGSGVRARSIQPKKPYIKCFSVKFGGMAGADVRGILNDHISSGLVLCIRIFYNSVRNRRFQEMAGL